MGIAQLRFLCIIWSVKIMKTIIHTIRYHLSSQIDYFHITNFWLQILLIFDRYMYNVTYSVVRNRITRSSKSKQKKYNQTYTCTQCNLWGKFSVFWRKHKSVHSPLNIKDCKLEITSLSCLYLTEYHDVLPQRRKLVEEKNNLWSQKAVIWK